MNKGPIFFATALIAGCASGGVYSGANRAQEIYADIVSCGKNLNDSDFEKQCRYDFKDSRMNIRVESVKMLGVNYVSIFGDVGNPKRRVHCQVKGTAFRLEAEKLKAKQIVEIQATPSEVALEDDMSYVVFDECDLKSL